MQAIGTHALGDVLACVDVISEFAPVAAGFLRSASASATDPAESHRMTRDEDMAAHTLNKFDNTQQVHGSSEKARA
eukprot:2225452-Rhodomonas_salina.1